MIVFEKISWMNFLSSGNVPTELILNKTKSTLIVGSNGAGKSTLLDALSFVLYGRPFRKINKPQLINSINNKHMLVELDFSIINKRYKIRRGMKPTVFEIYVNDTLLNQSADPKEYQDHLERTILKLNHKSFTQIVTLGSASFVPFMQLPAAHRREIIEDLLDIEVFSSMNILLKDRMSANRQQINENESLLKSIEDRLIVFHNSKKMIHQAIDQEVDQHEKEIKRLGELVESKQQRVNAINQKINELLPVSETLKIAEKKHNQHVVFELQFQHKREHIEKSIEFYQNNSSCSSCKQPISEDYRDQRIASLQEKINELAVGASLLQKNKQASEAILKTVRDAIEDIRVCTNEITSENKIISLYKDQIEEHKQKITQLRSTNSQLDYSNEEIKGLETQKQQHDLVRHQLIEQRSVYELAAVLLKDTGIKTKIIKQYIPVMNKLINKYLAAMDFFVNFELNENFEEVIKSRFRDEFSYESFSEGEKCRIDLALLFTWRAISKLRNSVATNLLIMDEVFDSSLDNTGSEELMKIINASSPETNIVIISHKGDQLFDKFENVIRFEKHHNFSRISQ